MLTGMPETRYSPTRLCLGACGAPFLDGYLLTSVGLVWFLPVFMDFGNAWTIGVSAFAYILGAFFGALAGGKFGDAVGRKRLFCSLPIALTLVCAALPFCTTTLTITVSRFLLGLITGSDSPVAQAMVAENTPKRARAKSLTWLMNAWFIGAIAAAGFAWLASEWALSWQLYLLSAACLAFVCAWIRHGAPESVLWLIHRGRNEQAQLSLQTLGVRDISELAEEQNMPKTAARFSHKSIGHLIFISVFWFCQAAPVTAVMMFGPMLLGSSAQSGETEFAGTILADSFFLLGSLAALGIISKARRRPLILWTFVLMAAGFAMLSQVSHFPKVFLWSALLIYSLPYGIQSVLDYVYPAELFSTRIRSTALGILGSTSRLGSLLSALFFPVAFLYYGQEVMCLAGGFLLVFGFVISYLFAPETHAE